MSPTPAASTGPYGFYSYELLEDLVGCEMPRLEHLDPQLQRWRPGDKLWMYPPEAARVLLVARWRRQLALLLATGAVFQFLTLLQPPLSLGILCTLGLLFFARPGAAASEHRPATQLGQVS